MSRQYDFDVAVIGTGPAGYVAAIRAAQLGASTCVIEKGELGGVCANAGCIPTKVLWQTAELMLTAGRADEYGLDVQDPKLNYAVAAARRDGIVAKLRAGIQALLGANKVELIRGAARFADPHALNVKSPDACPPAAGRGERRLSARSIIVATGSKTMEIPVAPFDHEVIVDSTDAVLANELPESAIVIGGGYIGVEFASIYSACGVQVTIVEALDRLLPNVDADCAREVAKFLKARGVAIHTATKIEEARRDPPTMRSADKPQAGSVRARLSNGQEVSARRMLVCVGRGPTVEGLDVEKAGLKAAPHGGLAVNAHMQTAVPHVYAAGDVAGTTLLAHVGSHEGLVAAAHATGDADAAMDYRVVPACVFAHPEVASVGMTEEQARQAVGEVIVKRFPLRALGKALISGHPDGLVKMVADMRTGELLGVHIAAVDASSLLGEAALAVKLRCTAEQLADTIHAHPTLAEALREAADGVVGMPINWRG